MDEQPQRKRPAHFPSWESQNRAVIVFLTVCTKDRRPLLANPAAHKHLRAVWQNATHWLVGRYLLMPDHVHLFCAPGTRSPEPLKHWIGFWKSRAAANWPPPRAGRIWQRDGWDTQLRTGQSYGEKWAYVRNNPVRAGLVSHPDNWPHQGELNILRWHE